MDKLDECRDLVADGSEALRRATPLRQTVAVATLKGLLDPADVVNARVIVDILG